LSAAVLLIAQVVLAAPPPPDFDISDSTPARGESVTFTARVTAPETIVSYNWDFGDGRTMSGPDPEVSHTYPASTPLGERTVTLTVTDSSGESSPASKPVEVVNAPPTARASCSPASVRPNEATTCTSNGSSDFEGPIRYAWDGEPDGANGVPDERKSDASEQFSFPTLGTKTIRLEVTDSNDATATAETIVTVVGNRPPTAVIECSPNQINEGDRINCTGSRSSDPDQENLRYAWSVDGGEFREGGPDFSPPSLAPGEHTITLRVTDAAGLSSEAAATFRVNTPPRASFSVAPENAFVGDTVTLSSSSADPDGPIARQEWDLDNDGQFDDATGAVVSTRFASPGTYPLKLRVTDTRSATATAEGRVNVQNRPVPPTPLLTGVVVELRALVFRRDTKVRWLRVRAPAGSKVTVRCRGKRCPKGAVKTSKRSNRMMRLRAVKTSKGSKKTMRFKAFERRFRPKTTLVVTVTKSGFIGTQTTFTMRRRKAPIRRNLCVPPGAKKASGCPEQ
jgi:PKD repeat protein